MTKPTHRPKGRPYADTVRTVLYLPRELREQFADNKQIVTALQKGLETMNTLTIVLMPQDSTDEELEARMTELCEDYEEAYATCELTSDGYRIKVTDEPQA